MPLMDCVHFLTIFLWMFVGWFNIISWVWPLSKKKVHCEDELMNFKCFRSHFSYKQEKLKIITQQCLCYCRLYWTIWMEKTIHFKIIPHYLKKWCIVLLKVNKWVFFLNEQNLKRFRFIAMNLCVCGLTTLNIIKIVL